jgi:hypothetical protein
VCACVHVYNSVMLNKRGNGRVARSLSPRLLSPNFSLSYKYLARYPGDDMWLSDFSRILVVSTSFVIKPRHQMSWPLAVVFPCCYRPAHWRCPGEGNAPMVISGSEPSSKVALEFVTVWWRALVIAVMISLSTEEIWLVDECIQVVTETVKPETHFPHVTWAHITWAQLLSYFFSCVGSHMLITIIWWLCVT